MERPGETTGPAESPEPGKQGEGEADTNVGFTDDELQSMAQPIDPALLALLGLC